jgi:hypothetical protein
MKMRILVVGLVCAVAAGAALFVQNLPGRSAHAAGGGLCANLYFQGGYGFAGEGFAAGAGGQVPEAFLGGFIAVPNTAAGATNGTIISGTETMSRQGTIKRLTFTGTFQIASNVCGGSVVLSTSAGTTLHYDFWMNQWSSGIAQGVNFIQTDPGATVELTVTHD